MQLHYITPRRCGQQFFRSIPSNHKTKQEVINIRAEDITNPESEAGVIASLIHTPSLIYYSENLRGTHFADYDNRAIYEAIFELVKRGISNIDAYNIMEVLETSEATKKYAERLTPEKLTELIDMSDVLARKSVEEYKLLANNVLDTALRRDAFQRLKKCQALCLNPHAQDVGQAIYREIDDVMTEYYTKNDVPPFSEVIDECWDQIQSRQDGGFAGIPFKFPTLNQYVTIERGELVIFAAEAKQGKSMMLLNCAIDLLKQDKAVLYLDSELNTRLFTARVLAHLTGIEYRRLTSGAYTPAEAEKIDQAIQWMKTRKFTHIYIPIFDVQSVYTTVKKVSHTQGLDVLIVDYFKASDAGTDAWESYSELGKFTNLVKNTLAGDMGIAAIGAAQATTTGKVADSAKIGRNASTIIMLTDKTQEEVERDGPECGNKKMRVVLNRNGAQMAPDEYIDMQFSGDRILYEEAKQHQPAIPY